MDMNTVYVVGHGRTQPDNPIMNVYTQFFVGFSVNVETDEIVDASASFILDETKSFVRALFVGKKFNGVSEDIISEIEKRYWGSSQRALIVAYKDAVKHYVSNKKKYYSDFL
ncbi:DUF3870 domain-containing protein [Fusibacter sp. JL216-2]|uniref:DUF3870 domain-containing protein n=1 Tax=Fusibacter sp. JL216-2 TaxID=3071453 RepID=UPI003D34F1B8